MNEFSRKPAHTVTELASARQHQRAIYLKKESGVLLVRARAISAASLMMMN